MKLLGVLGVIGLCYFGSSILIPVVISVLFFLLLDPAVSWMESKHTSRKLSSPILILLVALGGVTIGWAGYGAFANIGNQLPQYSTKLKKMTAVFEKNAKKIEKSTDNMLPKTTPTEDVQKVQVVERFGGVSGYLLRGLDSMFAIVVSLFLIPILTLFLLLEKDHLGGSLRDLASPWIETAGIYTEMTKMVRGFFIGNFVIGLGTSVVFFAIFSFIGLENKLGLALSAGFLNLIPLLGAILGIIFPLAQGLLQFDSAGPFLEIIGISIFVHFAVANFVIPKVIGSQINVNSTMATIGLLVWGWAWGAIGIILAVPLMSLLRIFFAARPTTRAWASLIAENPTGPVTRLWIPKPKKPLTI